MRPAPPSTITFNSASPSGATPLPPALDDDLLIGEEVHRVLALAVEDAQERLLAAPEREERHRRGQPHVHPHLAAVHLRRELAGGAPAPRGDVRAGHGGPR